MTPTSNLPLWLALTVSFFLVTGALITLIGTLGLFRFRHFFDRSHAPTLGSTLGAFLVLFASMLYFSITQHRFVIHEILITIFILVTTPVTLMMLGRAAFYRDRALEKKRVIEISWEDKNLE